MHDSWPLLRNDRLNGTYSIERLFRPPTPAQIVARDNFASACEVVVSLCDSWGGAYMPLVPINPGQPIDDLWVQLVDRSPVDGINERDLVDTQSQLGYGYFTHTPTGLYLLRMLMDLPIPTNHVTVQTARGVSPDDPWYLSYLGTFGDHPPEVTEDRREWHGIAAGFNYDGVVPIKQFSGTTGPADILNRLRKPNTMTAVELTLSRLGYTEAPVDLGFPYSNSMGLREWAESWRFGPNVVVVYEQDSVEDLALLWYLRALNGFHRGFPLAVPAVADVPAALSCWQHMGAQRHWGFAGGDMAVISASVDSDLLKELVTNTRFEVASASEVLRPLGGCQLHVTDTAHYTNGRAEIPRFVPTEIEALGRAALKEAGGWSRVTTIVTDSYLPPSRTLRRSGYPHHGYLHGYIAQTSTNDNILEVFHPSGLEVLDALARDQSQTVRRSVPGRAAAQLIEMIGGMPGITRLACPTVTILLGELTRGRSSSIVKKQLRQFLKVENDAETKNDRYRLLESRLEEALAKPDVEDVGYKTVNEIRTIAKLSREAGNEWIQWANRRGMLLRGFQSSCENCSHKQWRPLADAVPELICHGCGQVVPDPLGLDTAQIRYRAGETLLRAMNFDVLSHVLALRYLCEVWDGRVGGGPRNVFGAYPGLELVDAESKQVVAEADVAVILSNGRWIVGECKTTALGLRESDLTKLWDFADRVNAPATFVATLQSSAECGEIWQRTSSPSGRPHFALTAEHLYNLNFSTVSHLGKDPLAWRTQYNTSDGTAGSAASDFSAFLSSVDEDTTAWRRAPWTHAED
ncbi:hypothetical protein IU450_26845 [Nocardia abscessus]|uniref:hypothetical protein n=1 Tax=Nocardia abscessus TaxID=120957 RepID=UPI001894C97E|nr:hypothetical protein [Nocardia abscessus]MBF6339486.1 hypothetical protein [Nocardia abscessus]